MGIIKNHLAQMKAEKPAEYKRLMKGYKNEKEFLREVLGLTNTAMKHYLETKEGKSPV
jgi:hypothetical protein